VKYDPPQLSAFENDPPQLPANVKYNPSIAHVHARTDVAVYTLQFCLRMVVVALVFVTTGDC
jgi:hypothetical protein